MHEGLRGAAEEARRCAEAAREAAEELRYATELSLKTASDQAAILQELRDTIRRYEAERQLSGRPTV